MITPKDIHDKEFKRSVRGYDLDDVDRFLDLVIKDLEELYKENASLKEEKEILRKKLEKYVDIESSLNRALISAEKAADNTIKEAMSEKDRIINEATVKAVLILDKAKEDAKSFNTVNQDLIDQSDKFKKNLISLFEKQISNIKEFGQLAEDKSFAKEIEKRIKAEELVEEVKENSQVIEETAIPAVDFQPAQPAQEDFSTTIMVNDFSQEYEEEYDAGLFDEEEEEFKNKVFKFLEK